jgi:hypothetical protein
MPLTCRNISVHVAVTGSTLPIGPSTRLTASVQWHEIRRRDLEEATPASFKELGT